MKRGLLFVLVGALVLAGIVWVVQFERQRISDQARETAAAEVTNKAENTLKKSAAAADRILDKATKVSGQILSDARRKPGDAGEGGKAAASAAAKNDPAELVHEIFRTGHELSGSADAVGQQVLSLSVEDERKLGKSVHQRIVESMPLLGADAAERLQRLAAPILKMRARQEIDYQFFVVGDDEVNAFSHAGGYVYVNQGLLDLAKSDAELQFVLGHEIAHVDLRHCIKGLTYAARASNVAGDDAGKLVQIAYGAISVGYTKENEFEADDWSFRKMLALGHTREEALAFPRRMLDYFSSLEPGSAKAKTVLDAGKHEIQNHFRSHPTTKDRVERLEAISAEPPQ